MGARRGLGVVALAIALAGTGCSAGIGEPDSGDPDSALAGTWLLVSGRTADGPLVVTPDTHVTLTFDDDGMGGKAPCNDYGADYELDGDSFEVPGSGIERTLMGCGQEPEALESAYLSALTEVDTVTRDGDTLTMTGADDHLELRLQEPWPRADVVDRRWVLAAWTDDAGVVHRPTWERGRRPFVRLGQGGDTGGRISASTGCRVLEGRWLEWRGAPHVARAEWHGECPDRLMDQEMAVGNALSEPVLEVRERAGRTELVLRYAHGNGPAEVVYRR
ncbi:META domain-containing protein [Nocardioides astragali]|uniref:META domain-containing protein n=1 Tax=Nocardioides astragali TaxID=1776736 RepID=A0ABW2NAE9_9ACTN|nr:META domain-containing protein [Nocardioides astragali]